MGSAEIIVVKVPGLTPEAKAYLENDPVGNAYPLSFVSREPDRATLWVAQKNGQIRGHLFIYHAREFSTFWAYLAGPPEVVSGLIDELPVGRTVATAPLELSPTLTNLPGVTEDFVQQIMAVKRGEERFVDPSPATRLGPEHAAAYAQLAVPHVVPVTEQVIELNREFLSKEVVYGIFTADRTLAAVAGTNARSPLVWIVSGVETAPLFRRRGFGTKVVAAVTRDGLESVGCCALYVDKEARDAVRLYERLGYRSIREVVVLDFGTEMAH